MGMSEQQVRSERMVGICERYHNYEKIQEDDKGKANMTHA